MKIAFVSDAIYPYTKGGKETKLFELSTKFVSKDYDFHIYTMQWWKGDKNRKENGVYLHGISKLVPLYSGERRSIKQGIWFGIASIKLIKENFDVLHADNMPFFPLFSLKLVSVLKRKKLLVTWNEVWGKDYWIEYMGKIGIFGYIIESLASYLPDEIITTSHITQNQLIKNLNIPQNKITLIGDGADFNKIQKIKPSNKNFDVIYAGRLISHKNVDILIKSIKKVAEKKPNIKCLIIGDGPQRNYLENLSINLKLDKNIKFIGSTTTNEVYAYMKSSKIFVFPSIREGFGIVVIEANASGIPVIVINHKNNASKDLIQEDKNGYICNLDEVEIANTILKVTKNNLNNDMKNYCINSAKKYDWNKIINKIEKVYLQ